MRIKVGFIFGGESVEHEVSIISAIQAMNKIDEEKYEVVPIYITKDREWYTGELLKDIEVYQDLKLLKKYAKNVVLYYKNGSYVLQTKGLFKRIVNTIDIAFPVPRQYNYTPSFPVKAFPAPPVSAHYGWLKAPVSYFSY